MARKTVITVGLPDDVLKALEVAQHKMYCAAVGVEVPDAGLSRALVVEILLRESLERRGFLESEASDASDASAGVEDAADAISEEKAKAQEG